jgi:hypothetical protein
MNLAATPPRSLSRRVDDALACAREGNALPVVHLLREIGRNPPGAEAVRLADAVRAHLGVPGGTPGAVLDAADFKSPQLPEQLPQVAGMISVVTCCMNRTENLLKALPTWLALPEVSEVVVVDWSSREPVAASLRAAGISDARVRVVRVDDEPRWILSFAFNLGFRVAQGEYIVKADADITLKPDFFLRNPLPRRCFVAGNWREAPAGQEHINGFFYLRRADLLGIKGFNEYITTYGWDDDDIYARMIDAGLQRLGVDLESLWHIPHDDAARVGDVVGEPGNAWAELERDPAYKIRTNRWLAFVMPPWNGDRAFAPFEVIDANGRQPRLRRRVHQLPQVVSDDIRTDAAYYAALERLSWRCGPTAHHTPRAAVAALLQHKRLSEISAFDLTVAAHGGVPAQRARRHTLLLELETDVGGAQAAPLARALDAAGLPEDVCVCINGGLGDARVQLAEALGRHGQAYSIDFWTPYDGLERLREAPARQLLEGARRGSGAWVRVSAAWLARLATEQATPVPVARPRLYIDTQHGLGNRLRALGSAAAVAEASDRELVVLWTPDHHCECSLRDLFEYPGAVIESPDELPATLRRYNYMEIEPGAVKGEPVDTAAAGDLVVRSAYVLNHPASYWDSENKLLKALRPTAEVQALVDSVPIPAQCLGAHVRMEAGAGLDHHSYDSAANWNAESHAQIHHWRAKSHYSAFMRRIDQLLSEGNWERLFLATDLPENYRAFAQTYRNRVIHLGRSKYDRSKEQIQYALADAILLSKCTLLLGSTWSSFSELACRLSTRVERIEMSGVDF